MDSATLSRLLRAMNARPRDILRTTEPVYHDLGLKNPEISDDELIALMIKHPDLIQRPILEVDDRAVLGRPTERLNELLGGV